MAYYDENSRKVLIISNDPKENGAQVQHCIKWDEGTDAVTIGKAIEDVLMKVKSSSPPNKSYSGLSRKSNEDSGNRNVKIKCMSNLAGTLSSGTASM